jgi:ATP-binding cassette subfamily F protein 3
MSNLLQLQDGAKSYGTRELFSGASFAINAGEHVGVIGPNGAGKTTLFKILTGQEQLDRGQLVQMRGLRIGYLAQHDLWTPGTLVEDFLEKGAHMPLWEMKSLGRGLGLDEDHYGRAIDSLSGGYRMRVKLLQLLGQVPDLLLLDEPTNYLDLESLIVLENFLRNTEGAFLLISHDREFLRRTTDHILEVEAGDMVKYNGSLDDYFEQKEMLRTQLEARARTQEEKKKDILDFVARFGAKASKARQAQSRMKSLEKMETIEIKALPNAAKINIPPPRHCGKTVLTMTDLTLGYGDKTILKNVSLTLERGDHLAVVGVNGAGKSTLLKTLAGKLEPLKGETKLGYEVVLGYYAQHVAEGLRPTDSVLHAMSAKMHPDVTAQQVKNLAGSLLFSGDDVHKPVSVLSGGEKSRVALGQILLQRAPFLVLDEPTNHLDFQTVEALTEALASYEGTVVVVSHDRAFIRRVGTKILEIRDGQAHTYLGTYEEYVWSVQKGILSQRGEAAQAKPSPKSVSVPADPPVPVAPSIPSVGGPEVPLLQGNERKVVDRELKQIEKDLARAERKLTEAQARQTLLNEEVAAKPQDPKLRDWLYELAEIQRDLESLEEAWLELGARREELQRRLGGTKP